MLRESYIRPSDMYQIKCYMMHSIVFFDLALAFTNWFFCWFFFAKSGIFGPSWNYHCELVCIRAPKSLSGSTVIMIAMQEYTEVTAICVSHAMEA
jgi:hypothetical protein